MEDSPPLLVEEFNNVLMTIFQLHLAQNLLGYDPSMQLLLIPL